MYIKLLTKLRNRIVTHISKDLNLSNDNVSKNKLTLEPIYLNKLQYVAQCCNDDIVILRASNYYVIKGDTLYTKLYRLLGSLAVLSFIHYHSSWKMSAENKKHNINWGDVELGMVYHALMRHIPVYRRQTRSGCRFEFHRYILDNTVIIISDVDQETGVRWIKS